MDAPLDFVFARLLADLKLFAVDNAGKVQAAKDVFHVLELLQARPSSWVAILSYEGDSVVGRSETCPVVRGNFGLYVAANLGLQVELAKPLYDAGDDNALLRVMSLLKTRVLSLNLDSDLDNPGQTLNGIGARFEYDGTTVMNVDGVPLYAYRLGFTTDAEVGAWTEREPSV